MNRIAPLWHRHHCDCHRTHRFKFVLIFDRNPFNQIHSTVIQPDFDMLRERKWMWRNVMIKWSLFCGNNTRHHFVININFWLIWRSNIIDHFVSTPKNYNDNRMIISVRYWNYSNYLLMWITFANDCWRKKNGHNLSMSNNYCVCVHCNDSNIIIIICGE